MLLVGVMGSYRPSKTVSSPALGTPCARVPGLQLEKSLRIYQKRQHINTVIVGRGRGDRLELTA